MGSPKPCHDKTRYTTGATARRGIENIRKKGGHRDKKPVRAYRCPHCHGYHLTSDPG